MAKEKLQAKAEAKRLAQQLRKLKAKLADHTRIETELKSRAELAEKAAVQNLEHAQELWLRLEELAPGIQVDPMSPIWVGLDPADKAKKQ